MGTRAGIPGRAPALGPQAPYACPDDPMPRDASGLAPGVVNEKTPARVVMPQGEIHSVPRANPNETPIFRGTGAEGMADDMRTGTLPKAPGAPKAPSLSAPKRHR